MSAVITRADRPQTAEVIPMQEAPSLMQIISRIAQDPTMDLDRLEKFMAMQERMEARQAERAFYDALASAQSEMRVVVADKENSQTNSKYASYAALDSAIRPIYTKYGFSVTFDTDDCAKTDYLRVIAEVTCGSHKRPYHLDMPADGKGAKGGDVMTKTHAVMSATSYGKRGLLILIFNIPVADRWDDDGNAASGSATEKLITENQVLELRDLLLSMDRDEKQFCKRIKVDSLADIVSSKYADAKGIIISAGPRVP